MDPFESSLFLLATRQPHHLWGTFTARLEVTVYLCTVIQHVKLYVKPCVYIYIYNYVCFFGYTATTEETKTAMKGPSHLAIGSGDMTCHCVYLCLGRSGTFRDA